MTSEATLDSLTTELSERNIRNFLLSLFGLLDEVGVCYCVLHSWDTLPDALPNDLDLGILNSDRSKLAPVFAGLREKGYVPIQSLNHSADGNFFVFFWQEGFTPKTAAVDIVSEHRRGGMILATDTQLVARREKQGAFWIASPEVEFSYLLAKKAFKRKASERQTRRLAYLVSCLGQEKAESLASSFLPRESAREAVQSCIDGTAANFLQDGRSLLWRTSFTRRSAKLIPYFGKEGLRLVRRWFEPTGILVAIVGPDGVGKSTLISNLVMPLELAFWRRHKLFHWRPNVIAPKPDNGPETNPQGKVVRGKLFSIIHLIGFFLDYCIGYPLVIRPLLAKSNFVVFDRYFHDVLVDPVRYRYGGPMWFAKFLSRFVPEPDIVFVLEADTDLIWRRKPELSQNEIDRQRAAYQQLRFRHSRVVTIKTGVDLEESIGEASQAVASYMKDRFDRRLGGWLTPSRVELGMPS